MENIGTSGLMSVEEYLELERDSEVRHEYVGGVIHAMTRTTLQRHRIAEKAAGGPCRVYIENAKVRIGDDLVYYPDIMVVCGPESDDPYVERDPCLLVEVVSPSTEHIDRREKFAFYQSISTLKAYTVVEQNRPVVERFFRDEEGERGRAAHFETGSFPVPCPETRLSISEVYEGL